VTGSSSQDSDGAGPGSRLVPASSPAPSVSYSVSYFNWTVSSSEDECEQVTLQLDRMKIRRTSRERNENLKDKELNKSHR